MKPDIEIDYDSVTVNGTRFAEPPTVDRLSRILGPPSDTRTIGWGAESESPDRSKTRVWQWSELGIQVTGWSDTEINTFSVFLDSNLQCSTLGSDSQYTLRYTSDLHLFGLDAMQSGTIEELKGRAIANNLHESTGGDHSTATFWFSGGKFELFSTGPEKGHVYLSEEKYTQAGKPVFYKVLAFRYAQKEKVPTPTPPAQSTSVLADTQQVPPSEPRYIRQTTGEVAVNELTRRATNWLLDHLFGIIILLLIFAIAVYFLFVR